MNQEPTLPSWAEELRLKYLSGEASMFLLHGNVRDIYPWTDGDGGVRYMSLREFLERFLCRSKQVVVYYNLSEGLEFPDAEHQRLFKRMVDARRSLRGEGPMAELPHSPGQVLPLLEDTLTDVGARAGVILDYVETIVPMGDLGFMSEGDKSNLIALQRWSADPALLRSDNLVILVAENLSDVHRRVVASAQLVAVTVPLPDYETRRSFVTGAERRGAALDIDEEALGKVTAGLSLTQIRGLFRHARQTGDPITFRAVSRRKKAIIEQECHGLVEFVDPAHDFSHVGGMDGLKDYLMQVAGAIKRGQTNRVPMGILFVGPMGTGKTYIAEAFAAESGLTCLKFKNFREKWVGSTEGNLEKILTVVDGLGYVLLIIDEADRSMGAGGGEGDGGTTSRVIARLKEFMSDTSHRGRVVMLMMTNRPDKLDTDLKRPGRFDTKVPFFFPEEEDERRRVLAASARKNQLLLEAGVDPGFIAALTAGYSAAELEAVLLAAVAIASDGDRDAVSEADLVAAVREYIPSRDVRMLEFMEMLAVFESSTRRMLPARFRDLDNTQVQSRLDELREQLGRRVQ